jgi:exoribonuclease II
MTPDKLIQSLSSFKKGDIGFCAIASVSTKNDGILNNIGFWFEIIENKLKLVLSVKMDSFTIHRPAPSMVITGIEQLHDYIKSVRQWAEHELTAFFYVPKSSYCKSTLEYHEHSLSA